MIFLMAIDRNSFMTFNIIKIRKCFKMYNTTNSFTTINLMDSTNIIPSSGLTSDQDFLDPRDLQFVQNMRIIGYRKVQGILSLDLE